MGAVREAVGAAATLTGGATVLAGETAAGMMRGAEGAATTSAGAPTAEASEQLHAHGQAAGAKAAGGGRTFGRRLLSCLTCGHRGEDPHPEQP